MSQNCQIHSVPLPDPTIKPLPNNVTSSRLDNEVEETHMYQGVGVVYQ